MESGGWPFRGFITRLVSQDAPARDETADQQNSSETSRMENMASTGGTNGGPSMNPGEYVRDNSALLSLQPWIFRRETCRDDRERRENGFPSGVWTELYPGNIGNRSSYRSRRCRRYYFSPLTSTENCFIPGVYNDLEFEDYVYSSIPSSTVPTLRPLLITAGRRIISKSSYGSSENSLENELHEDVGWLGSRVMGGKVGGVPPLFASRKLRNSRKVQNGRYHTSISQNYHGLSHPQGFLDGVFVLCLGIGIGAMYTVLSHRREVEKLNNRLRRTENLVQDLQEELNMNNSVTVMELCNEPHESQDLIHRSLNLEKPMELSQNQIPTSKSPSQETNTCDQSHLPNVGEISEARSKMEAELEAELEILERSMSTSSVEQRMSNYSELDPDLIAEVVHGELRADMLDQGAQGAQSDTSGICTATTQSANRAVSPRELTLRLHEVIESRLEEQIRRLEKELQHCQRQLQFMEAARLQRTFSSSDVESSSNKESPRAMELESSPGHPFCLNLFGDALDAYDEAYEEFMRLTKMEEDNLPSSITQTGEKTNVDRFYTSN